MVVASPCVSRFRHCARLKATLAWYSSRPRGGNYNGGAGGEGALLRRRFGGPRLRTLHNLSSKSVATGQGTERGGGCGMTGNAATPSKRLGIRA